MTQFVFASLVLCVVAFPGVGRAAESADSPLAWPTITREARPWAYWWWMASAVDETNLTKELTRYRDAGYGGVHIIPIYGAKGWETNYLTYLSPRWMSMLNYTVTEARRLGLDVDMTTGTGWCFGGGPNVTEAEGNAAVVMKTFDVPAGGKVPENLEAAKTHALVAFSADGKNVDLTKRIRPDGSVNWTAREVAKVYAVSQRFAGQKVKRAGPGGEGPMLNLLYPGAMGKFLQPFTDAFAKYDGAKPRSQYHDSYEYRSDWSPDFLKQFEQRRGYKLQTELPALFAINSRITNHASRPDPDRIARVLCDYRETASDIQIEDSLPQWVKWSHDRGFLTRNEAHGSPGNLLDLYALADVPETEMFRLDRNKLISKFASSAAHVAGRKFVGCETGTWLKEHFTETLADMKYLLDDLFLSGVNHVFYHGTCYSPDEARWPGWLFYASYEMNPRNAVWHDAPALNAYVARCQSILQGGTPDNDILLYWPIHDFWSQPGGRLLPHLTVHARDWFEAQPVGHAAEKLWQRGYSFDYVSDRQLAAAQLNKEGGIETGGVAYRVVVVPACEQMPLPTLRKLFALAEAGATVIFENGLPRDVPGLANLERRRFEFRQLTNRINRVFGPRFADTTRSVNLGRGRIFVGALDASVEHAGVAREALFDQAGLMGIRRAFDGGRHYFIANRGEKVVEGWIPLATAAKSAIQMDALNGRVGLAASREAKSGVEVYLRLGPGESVILRALTNGQMAAPAWSYARPSGQPRELTGAWQVKFIKGGPVLPRDYATLQADSWTANGDPEVQAFSGTAIYSLAFDAPAAAGQTFLLDLGKISQSARVRLNGKDLGTLIIPPFRVTVDNLKPTGNQLEVEVTSTSANRIRDLDRRGVKWQLFNDINFVNQDYRPFNAANWAVAESGLIGPVTLTVATTQ